MEHGIPIACVHRYLICGMRNIVRPSNIKIYCHYYKMILYGATEFKECKRGIDEVYNEALAIYHVTYDYANHRRDAKYYFFGMSPKEN